MNSDIAVAAVTVTGQKHLLRGIPCEDSSIALSKNGVSVVCVADGAGGKVYTHAKYGAECVTRTISELMCSHFDALYNENREAAVKGLVITAVQTAMADVISEHRLSSIERLSSTMLFCAVKDRRMMIGHIGDGLIARITPSGVAPLTMPQNGKNASTTYFVTANHAADYLRLYKSTTDDVHAIVLMTDGVQDSVYDENAGLVKPVVVRMAETLASGEAVFKKEVTGIIEKFIISKSNMSDDATFATLFVKGTEAPDPNKLVMKAPAFPRSEESFRQLQEYMLPQVKKARMIIANASLNKPSVEETKDSKSEPIRNSQTDTQAQETEDKLSKAGRYTLSKRAVFSIILFVLILVLIGILIYMFNH